MLITTIHDSENDDVLIKAMKSMPWSTIEIELEGEIGTKVTVANKDFNRFIDLAEYGLKMMNTIEETKEEN